MKMMMILSMMMMMAITLMMLEMMMLTMVMMSVCGSMWKSSVWGEEPRKKWEKRLRRRLHRMAPPKNIFWISQKYMFKSRKSRLSTVNWCSEYLVGICLRQQCLCLYVLFLPARLFSSPLSDVYCLCLCLCPNVTVWSIGMVAACNEGLRPH